jgi:RNase P subunit RPR2
MEEIIRRRYCDRCDAFIEKGKQFGLFRFEYPGEKPRDLDLCPKCTMNLRDFILGPRERAVGKSEE